MERYNSYHCTHNHFNFDPSFSLQHRGKNCVHFTNSRFVFVLTIRVVWLGMLVLLNIIFGDYICYIPLGNKKTIYIGLDCKSCRLDQPETWKIYKKNKNGRKEYPFSYTMTLSISMRFKVL